METYERQNEATSCHSHLNLSGPQPAGPKGLHLKVITTWTTAPGSDSSFPAPIAAFDTLMWLSGLTYT